MAKKPYSFDDVDIPEVIDTASVEATENVEESLEPTAEELMAAKQLEGSPNRFEELSVELFNAIVRKGLAADAGDGMLMRGFKWHNYFR